MSDRTPHGGIAFGDVGGSVQLHAGGDIVGGDKSTSQTPIGAFAEDSRKQSFLADLDALRQALRELRTQLDANAELDADAKDEIVLELVGQIKALAEAKTAAAQLPVGHTPGPGVAARVESALKRAGGLLEALEAVGRKGAGVATIVGEFAAKYGPLLLSARRLFGLP